MKKLFVLFMAVCLMLSLVACAGNTTTTDPVESTAETTALVTESLPSFTVTVVDEKLNGVSGVMLQVCKDTCVPMVTDENGVAVFNFEPTSEHKLSVLTCPEGYVYNGEPEVYLVDGVTEYKVELDFNE